MSRARPRCSWCQRPIDAGSAVYRTPIGAFHGPCFTDAERARRDSEERARSSVIARREAVMAARVRLYSDLFEANAAMGPWEDGDR